MYPERATPADENYMIDPAKKGEPGRANKFRIRSRNLLLTYMFDDEDNGPSANEVKERITSRGGKCTIAIETAPETGRRHLHVYATNENQFNSRRHDYFDVGIYHPNIKYITHDPPAVWRYVTKGGNILIEDVPCPEKKSKKRNRQDEVFAAALSEDTLDDMLKTLQDNCPRTYCTSFNNIFAAAQYKHPRLDGPGYSSPSQLQTDLNNFPEISDWITTYLPDSVARDITTPGGTRDPTPSLTSGSSDSDSIFSGESLGLGSTPQTSYSGELTRYEPQPNGVKKAPDSPQARPKSLILWGPTRTGKTLFARSLGQHSYHATEFNLAAHSEEATYAVFDDLKEGLKTNGFDYKAWLGGQHQFNCSDKYTKKRVIKWGKPSIYISNDDPLLTLRSDVNTDWIQNNCVIVYIGTQIAWVG